jgi:hypothetical protein
MMCATRRVGIHGAPSASQRSGPFGSLRHVARPRAGVSRRHDASFARRAAGGTSRSSAPSASLLASMIRRTAVAARDRCAPLCVAAPTGAGKAGSVLGGTLRGDDGNRGAVAGFARPVSEARI